jgi:nucleotide-binding universal stress UspA family protein
MKHCYFKRVAVAMSFQSHTDDLLQAASQLKHIFNCELHFIHVGPESPDLLSRAKGLLAQYGLEDTPMTWLKGRALDQILSYCDQHGIDLLLCGSAQRVGFFQYYMGTIGCDLLRKANCSVMVIVGGQSAEGTHIPLRLSRIAVNVDDQAHSEELVELGMRFVEAAGQSVLHVTKQTPTDYFQMVTSDSLSYAENVKLKREIVSSEQESIHKQLDEVLESAIKVKTQLLFGKPGVELSNFAQQKEIDLLIFREHQAHFGLFDRLFQHNVEFLLEDIPCNLLMVRMKE